jgi:hypothetical protein
VLCFLFYGLSNCFRRNDVNDVSFAKSSEYEESAINLTHLAPKFNVRYPLVRSCRANTYSSIWATLWLDHAEVVHVLECELP